MENEKRIEQLEFEIAILREIIRNQFELIELMRNPMQYNNATGGNLPEIIYNHYYGGTDPPNINPYEISIDGLKSDNIRIGGCLSQYTRSEEPE